MVVFPPVIPGDPVDVSASTYVTFRQCPERAAARLRGEYGADSPASFVGGLSHRIFARHLRGGPIDAAGFQQACREEIGSGMNAKVASLGLRPSQLGGIIEQVGELYERFKRLSFGGFAGAEVMLEAVPVEGVRLKGGVDAVFADEAGLRLVDWKTGQVGDDAGHQLSFYALLWTLERGELPQRVEAVSVKTGQSTSAIPTEPAVQETADRVAEMVDRLRSGWAAGTDQAKFAGPWCRYCPVLDSCSEGRAARRVLATA